MKKGDNPQTEMYSARKLDSFTNTSLVELLKSCDKIFLAGVPGDIGVLYIENEEEKPE